MSESIGGVGVTGGDGLEALVGRTGNIGLYFYAGVGFSFGETSPSAGGSVYVRDVFNAAGSKNYAGPSLNLSVPFAVIQKKLGSQFRSDAQIAAVAVASTIVGLPSQITWIAELQVLFAQAPAPSDSPFSINLFTDPKNYGGMTNGSFGYSLAYGKSFIGSGSNVAITESDYWQILNWQWDRQPRLSLSGCDGLIEACNLKTDNVPFAPQEGRAQPARDRLGPALHRF